MVKDDQVLDCLLDGRLSRRSLMRRAAAAGGAATLLTVPRSGYRAAAQDQSLEGSLTIWGWDAALNGLKVVDAAFTEAFPNITLEYVPRAVSDTYQQLQLAATAGSG